MLREPVHGAHALREDRPLAPRRPRLPASLCRALSMHKGHFGPGIAEDAAVDMPEAAD
jgi:hypothetical protein